MKPVVDILIDFEGLATTPNAVALELGAVAFVNDPSERPDYDKIKETGFRCKFNIKTQRGRYVDPDTVKWWKEQSAEAKAVLYPDAIDVTLVDGIKAFFEWLEEVGATGKSHLYCRGNNYDIPLLCDIMQQEGLTHGITQRFGKYRDVRTFIEATMGVRDCCKVPLPKGSMTNFVHHSGLDDCAKDAMMILYAQRYAYDLDEMPTNADDCEEVSV